MLYFWLAVGAGLVAVEAVLAVRAWRFQRTHPQAPSTGSPTWTLAPVVLLTVLAWFSLTPEPHSDSSPSATQPDLRVHVTARKYHWVFAYPGYQVSELGILRLPAGQTVEMEIEAEDVIHGFWVPDAGIKRDLPPGEPQTITWTTPETPGRHRLLCSVLCGDAHPAMTGLVRIMPADDFERWLSSERLASASSD